MPLVCPLVNRVLVGVALRVIDPTEITWDGNYVKFLNGITVLLCGFCSFHLCCYENVWIQNY